MPSVSRLSLLEFIWNIPFSVPTQISSLYPSAIDSGLAFSVVMSCFEMPFLELRIRYIPTPSIRMRMSPLCVVASLCVDLRSLYPCTSAKGLMILSDFLSTINTLPSYILNHTFCMASICMSLIRLCSSGTRLCPPVL